MELRRQLGAILDEAAAGERIVIERDHRPMAVLVPFGRSGAADETEDEAILRFEAALERLSKLGERIRTTSPSGLDAVTSIRMDRDHLEWSDNVRDHGRWPPGYKDHR
jgi:antitoxin (DNA-binding transcriptional repressor) of toxin-antitoxin stability system